MNLAGSVHAAKNLAVTLAALDAPLPAGLDAETLREASAEAEAAIREAAVAKVAAAHAVARQRAAVTRLNELAVRIRAVVRGTFGSDSLEYQQVGGTRRSERKPRRRKPRPA